MRGGPGARRRAVLRCAFAACLGLVVPAGALAQRTLDRGEGVRVLTELADAYRGVGSVTAEWRLVPGVASAIASDRGGIALVVLPDGRFMSTDSRRMRAIDGETAPGETRSDYIVWFDGRITRVTMSFKPRQYQETECEGWGDTAPGIVHWLKCPWPVVPRLAGWLAEADDLVVTASDGALTASSGQCMLGLAWEAPARVTRITWGSTPGSPVLEHTFSEFGRDARAPWLAARLVERIEMPSGEGATTPDMIVEYTLGAHGVVGADEGTLPAFDPATLGLNRYDMKTRNVYSPAGELLYNESDRAAMLAGAAPNRILRRTLVVGIVVLAAIACVFGVRRLKRGKPPA